MGKLSELLLGSARRRPFSFKRKKVDGSEVECHVEIQILTKHDMDLARVNARRSVLRLDNELKDGRAFDELLEDSRVVELLAIALRDPEKPEQPWATSMELEQILTTVEIAALWRAYEEHQADQGPILTSMTGEQFEAVLRLCAEEGDTDPLLLFASHTRRSFTHSLAKELLTVRTENALLISELNVPETPSSNESTPEPAAEHPEVSADG